MRYFKNIRRIFTSIFVFTSLFAGSVAIAASGTNTFTEDFVSTTYMDTAATTAAWADGSSFLHPSLTGVCAQAGPAVAKDASGNIVFAWDDWRSGTEAVYMSKFSPAGVKLLEDIKVADGGGPKIACDSSSNIYIVISPNNGSQVTVYKYNSNGGFLTSFRADTDALPGSAGNQEIAIDSSNNIYVVYTYLITKFNSAGTRLWGPVRANTHTEGDNTGQFNPDVAISGSYLYASHSNLYGTGPFGLDACRIDPATGNRLWANEINISNGAWMRIAADSAGNLCAAYSDNYTAGYKKLNSAGTVVAGPLTIDNQAYCYANSPDISIDSANNKYIIYKLNDSYPAAVYKIRAQKLSSTDALVWGTSGKQVSYDNAYMGFTPVCAPTPTGGVIGAWGQRMGLNGADNHDNLLANIVSSTGTRLIADDFCIHNAPEYAATAQGQSLTVDTVAENIPSATLTFGSPYYLFGQTGTFYLTNNGGTNWYQVTPGTKYNFPVNGSNLKFKAVFSTTTRSLNPKADYITVAYDYAPLTGDSTPPTGVPSTPTDQGAYTSAMQVTFNWTIGTAADPESGISNYFLQISTNSAFSNTVYSGDVGLVTSYTYNTPIDSLSRTYYARVRAKNGAGIYGSYSSASDGITTDHSSPVNSTNPPTDQGATTTSTILTFSWNQSEYSDPESGIASYILWVSTDKTYANSAATLFKGNVGKVGSYSVSGGVVGSTYYARVTAVNGAGLGDFYPVAPIYASDGITVIAGDTTAPTGVPAVPTDAGVYSTSTSLVFNWTAGTSADPESGIAGYSLQVSTTTAFTTFIFNGDTGNVLTKTITSCTNGQTYYARVRAKNGAGLYGTYSSYSNGIKIDITLPTGSPSIPTDAGASSTSTTITFNWTAGTAADTESGISGYSLQVSPSTAFSTFIFNGDVGNVLTSSVSGCINGQTYYARVRAKNGAGLYGSYTGASDGILINAGSTPTYTVTTTPYSWITTSTATGITMDDQSKLFTLPFTVTYYGTNYAAVNVCSNGFMSFVSNSAAYSPVTIPNSAQPNALLAAYWRDLNPAKAGSSITYGSYTDKFVVTWSVYNYANTNKQTFQIIIYKTGVIVYQYQTVTKDLTTVIGIENSGGTAGVSYASASIANGLALKFSPSTMAIAALGYAPSTDFATGETYVYPNPAKAGKKPTIHVEVGEADKVELYLYDVAGELQASVELTDTPTLIDGQYAYEYQWDTTDQASGVYIVRIIATKGSDKLKITRKFAVVK